MARSRGSGRSKERRASLPSEVGAEEPRSPERRPGRVALLVIAAALVCYLYPRHSFKEYRNVNEQARLYLVKAVVEEGVLDIDRGIRDYGDLQDKAVKDGHFYCDKPVGLSVVAVPVYWVLHLLSFGHPWTMQGMRYALTIFCVTLPAIVLLFLLERHWRGRGATAWLVGLGLLFYALGSIAFTYSTQFVGHQLGAVLAFAHFFLARDLEGRPAWFKLLLAGALAGLGAITDYFSALVHLTIFLSYAPRIRPLSAWLPFGVGGAVCFAPLPLYNLLAFGSMAKMSYGQEALPAYRELHGTGFFGVTFPRPESISGLLWSPAKGLVFFCPFLILGIVGIALLIRRRETRRDGIVMAISIVVIAWLACSVHDWRAGWTVGPRHMVSMLPFLATGVVEAVRQHRRLAGALVVAGVVSLALVFVPTLTLPAFDVNFVHPFTSQALFLLGQGIVSPNPGQMLGLPGAWSLLIPALVLTAVLVLVLLRTFEAGALRVGAIVGTTAALALAGWSLSTLYPAQPEPVRMYFQARVLKQADAPRLAGSRYEQAVTSASDPNVRRQVADRVYPEAAALYSSLHDAAALGRILESWERIDPANAKLRELTSALREPSPATR